MGTKIADAPRPIQTASRPKLKTPSVKKAVSSPPSKVADQVRLTRGGQEAAPSSTSVLTQGLAANFAPAAKLNGAAATPNGPGAKSVELARQFEGMLSQDVAGKLGDFGSAGRKTNNCADFVSSVLEQSGRGVERTEDVSALREQLLEKGWQVVPQEKALPGDVWMTKSDKHGSRHAELVTTEGGTHTIGSNNIASEEPQQQIFEREAKAGIFYGKRPAPAQ